jgi:two-component system, cell cycle response regulator CpdR
MRAAAQLTTTAALASSSMRSERFRNRSESFIPSPNPWSGRSQRYKKPYPTPFPTRSHSRNRGTESGIPHCRTWQIRNRNPPFPSVPMPRRALVADDDPLTRELIASMLEELGCETLTARSATDALGQLARDEGIDILFADVNMPGLSGRELAERARDFRPQLRVLLVSGLESDGRGFPLLRKPFSQSDLRRVMADTTGLCDD